MTVSLVFTRSPDLEVLSTAATVHSKMKDNPNFTNLAPTPDEVKASIDAFELALTSAAGGGRENTSRKNDARKALIMRLRSWSVLVAAQAGGDLTRLLSSGFLPQKARTPAGPLPAPSGMVLRITPVSGRVRVSTSAVANSSAYQLQSKPDADPHAEWTDHGPYTSSRNNVDGFVPGAVYWFRQRAVGAAGLGPWSEPGAIRAV